MKAGPSRRDEMIRGMTPPGLRQPGGNGKYLQGIRWPANAPDYLPHNCRRVGACQIRVMARLSSFFLKSALGLSASLAATPALGQRTGDNVVTQAQDAFGTTVGNEQIGLYSPGAVRGFSPTRAGNLRIDGLYFDLQGFTPMLFERTRVRVGLAAQGYIFPAPTGIVDYSLRGTATSSRSLIIGAGPFGTVSAEAEVRAASHDGRAGAAFDIALSRLNLEFGSSAPTADAALVLRWQPSPGLEIQPFAATHRWKDDDQPPMIFTDGVHLPHRIPRGHYLGQAWGQDGQLDTLGTIVTAGLTPRLQARAGLFLSRRAIQGDYTDLFLDTGADGLSHHVVVASPEQTGRSLSGEFRAAYSFEEGARAHRFTLSLRARSVERHYNGSASLDLGPVPLGFRQAVPEPALTFTQRTIDRISQTTGGLAYELRWQGLGELGLGLQRTNYRKVAALPGGGRAVDRDSPWLFYATASLSLSPSFAAFASFTRGLEESGFAPINAVNRGAAVRALRTRQIEAGLRLVLPRSIRLVADLFEIRKPYVTLNADNLFGPFGVLTHRGVEVSVSGDPLPGLHLVAGALLLDPRISGEVVDRNLIASRPIGQPRRIVRINLDYRFGSSPFSIDAAVRFDAARFASADNLIVVPPRTVIDLGLRYRFSLGGARATARLLVTNLANSFGWDVRPGGALTYIAQRGAALTLTTDF
jgi:iron complex outermembrane receptor protein